MKIRNFILGVGILVVYALVLWQGIQTFYPEPEWEEFCGNDFPRAVPIDKSGECEVVQGLETKIDACERENGHFKYEYDDSGCIVGGTCDECRINYEEARDNYSGRIFIIALIVGVLTFIAGFSVLKFEPVGSSLIAGGIWAVFYGTVWNWRNFGAGVRFALLLLVLVLLIFIAYRINKKGKSKLFKFLKKKW